MNQRTGHDVYTQPPPSSHDAGDRSFLTPLFGQVATLLRERAWFVGAAVVAFAGVLFVSYPRGVTFTSSAVFISEPARGTSPMSNIAAQIGIATPLQGSTTSPQFYLELIRTPRFLEAVAESPVRLTASGDTSARTVAEMLGYSNGDRRVLLAHAAEDVSNRLAAGAMGNTGMVRIAVQADSPTLAKAIAEVVLQQLGEFNQANRQTRASAERQFVETRVAEVSAQLREAENRLQRFLAENRDFSRAPALQFEYARLQREITLRQTLFASLSQAFEQARIEEVRDTPVITVVSPPTMPIRRDPLGRGRLLMLATLFALGAGIVAANVRGQMRKEGSGDISQRGEVARLARELREDLRRGRIRNVLVGRPRDAGQVHPGNGGEGRGARVSPRETVSS